MQVLALDHVNIVTDELDRVADFYVELFGLARRDAPPPLSPQAAQWLYDAGDRAVIHLNTPKAPRIYDRATPTGATTGALHHVALRCEGHSDALARLAAHGLDHRENRIDAIGLRQIFVTDPNNVLFELNFFGD